MDKNNILYSINIIRCFAALSVVFFHINKSVGSFGVDIFFVLSGYLMSKILYEKKPSFSQFFYYRMTRIIPIYWLATFLVYLLVIFTPESFNNTEANFVHFIKSIFFIPFFKNENILHPMLPVGWTLNYEFYFYLICSISILLGRKYKFYFIFLIISLFSFIALVFNNLPSNVIAFISNFIYLEFIYGIGLYFFIKKINYLKFGCLHNSMYLLYFLLVISISILIYIDVSIPVSNYIRFIYFGIPSLLIVFSTILLESSLKVFKHNALFRFFLLIGDSSYSIYIFHLFIIGFIDQFLKYLGVELFAYLYTLFVIFLTSLYGIFVNYIIDKKILYFLRGKIS